MFFFQSQQYLLLYCIITRAKLFGQKAIDHITLKKEGFLSIETENNYDIKKFRKIIKK